VYTQAESKSGRHYGMQQSFQKFLDEPASKGTSGSDVFQLLLFVVRFSLKEIHSTIRKRVNKYHTNW